MTSNSEPPDNVEVIYQLLEEVHTWISGLEQQLQSGLFPAQPEVETVEILLPENRSPFSENDSLL
jgi:translation initiation factor IF-2